jgi:membrane associated rhomboid family serine protease
LRQVRALPITSTLIALNIAVFGLELAWGGSSFAVTLVRMGAISPVSTGLLHAASLIAYGYLHFETLHIAMNMLALYSLGRTLEPMLGGSRFFVLYTLSLLGGGVAIAASPGPRVTVGASGAIFGLLGAVCALLWQRYRSVRSEEERRAIRSLVGGLLVPNVIISLLPGVSLLGHVGGFVVGAAFGMVFVRARVVGRPLHEARGSAAMKTAAVALAMLTLLCVAGVWWSLQPWRGVQDPSGQGRLGPARVLYTAPFRPRSSAG